MLLCDCVLIILVIGNLSLWLCSVEARGWQWVWGPLLNPELMDWLDWLASSQLCLCSGVCHQGHLFNVVLRIQTQVLMLAQQGPYPLGHLTALFVSVFKLHQFHWKVQVGCVCMFLQALMCTWCTVYVCVHTPTRIEAISQCHVSSFLILYLNFWDRVSYWMWIH